MKRIAKLTVAAATALGLAITPISATAAPDGEDIAKTLAGLAVLGIIVSAMDDDKDRKRRVDTGLNYRTIERTHDRRIIDGELRRPNLQTKPAKARNVRLPNRCVRVLDTRRGERLVYGKRCVDRNYIYADRLPDRCERLVRTDRGTRSVYAARCLAKDGWRVARR